MPKGRLFLSSLLWQCDNRATVNKALSRLVKVGVLERVVRGVYMRPKASKYAGQVRASPVAVIKLMAKANGESLQIHGAEAARLIGLSTQMQVLATFYTSGATRQIHVGNTTVRLRHASKDRFQYADTKIGLALTALHYIGKEALSFEVVSHIQKELSDVEFKALQTCQMPEWMRAALTPASS